MREEGLKLTRNGVCYDLRETPYIYEWRGITYHFSSEGHRAKFIRDLRKKELWLDDSLSRRFKVTISMPILADLQLYTQVETRGFYIVTNDNAEYTAPHQVMCMIDTQVIGIVTTPFRVGDNG